MTTVQILGESITLVLPASYTERYELLTLASDHPMRGLAAALGWCWPSGHPGKPKASPGKRGAPNWGNYGQAVLDDLLGRGVSLRALTVAGQAACLLLAGDLPGVEGVEEAEGFTEADAGDSTG